MATAFQRDNRTGTSQGELEHVGGRHALDGARAEGQAADLLRASCDPHPAEATPAMGGNVNLFDKRLPQTDMPTLFFIVLGYVLLLLEKHFCRIFGRGLRFCDS